MAIVDHKIDRMSPFSFSNDTNVIVWINNLFSLFYKHNVHLTLKIVLKKRGLAYESQFLKSRLKEKPGRVLADYGRVINNLVRQETLPEKPGNVKL